MHDREKIITNYFQLWIDRNAEVAYDTFADDIVYIESYGPAYEGLDQVLTWITSWFQNGSVLQWDIKSFVHQNEVTVCEWYFKCDYKNKVSDFNGVSVIHFNEDNKIVLLKEFQSAVPNTFPYRRA